MAEQEAVNFKVVGSSPARGARKVVAIPPDRRHFSCFLGADTFEPSGLAI